MSTSCSAEIKMQVLSKILQFSWQERIQEIKLFNYCTEKDQKIFGLNCHHKDRNLPLTKWANQQWQIIMFVGILQVLNKRTTMALNCSPEFKTSTQTQCSRAFWYLRPPFEQSQKSSTMKSSIPNFKHLSQVVLQKKIFEYFSTSFYGMNLGPPGKDPSWILRPSFEQNW